MSLRTLPRLAALSLLLLPLAGCTTPEQVRSPIWVGATETPDGQEFTPERAMRDGRRGHVMLLCRSHASDGSVSGCRVAYENPRGYGFGAAALRMTGGIDVRRTRTAAVRPDGLVLAPIRFCPDGPEDCAPPDDGPWPLLWGDPRLARVPLPPPATPSAQRTS